MAIGDRIWFDANRDGVQNTFETNGIASIPVALLDTNGNVLAETTSDNQGYYLFPDLPVRTYVLRFDLSAVSTNQVLSPAKVGGDAERSGRVLHLVCTTRVAGKGNVLLQAALGIEEVAVRERTNREREVLRGGAVIEREATRPPDDRDAAAREYDRVSVYPLVSILGDEHVVSAGACESTQQLPLRR